MLAPEANGDIDQNGYRCGQLHLLPARQHSSPPCPHRPPDNSQRFASTLGETDTDPVFQNRSSMPYAIEQTRTRTPEKRDLSPIPHGYFAVPDLSYTRPRAVRRVPPSMWSLLCGSNAELPGQLMGAMDRGSTWHG
jgi:hypothetical protein